MKWLKVLRISSYLVAIIWAASGLVVLFGLILSRLGLVINIVMGVLFILVGLYIIFKETALVNLLENPCQTPGQTNCVKVIVLEMVFLLFAIIIGIIIFSGASFRIFSEGLPVFG